MLSLMLIVRMTFLLELPYLSRLVPIAVFLHSQIQHLSCLQMHLVFCKYQVFAVILSWTVSQYLLGDAGMCCIMFHNSFLSLFKKPSFVESVRVRRKKMIG
ncbi:unnamed protein product [Tenebrio molitor]|nr:unnamed protein product [Tenebrio molitor]